MVSAWVSGWVGGLVEGSLAGGGGNMAVVEAMAVVEWVEWVEGLGRVRILVEGGLGVTESRSIAQPRHWPSTLAPRACVVVLYLRLQSLDHVFQEGAHQKDADGTLLDENGRKLLHFVAATQISDHGKREPLKIGTLPIISHHLCTKTV